MVAKASSARPSKALFFDAQLEYSKVAAPASSGTRMRFGGQTSRSVGGGEQVCGTSVICSVPNVDGTYTFQVNPGLAGLMPQAAPAASLFSQYRFDKLSLRYVPTVPSTTGGRIVIVFNNNVLSEPPLSFTAAASYDNAVGFNVWDVGVRMECADNLWRFVRNGPVPDGADAKTYDAGLLSVLVENVATEFPALGDIVCDYVISFQDRILQPPIGCEIIPKTLVAASNWFDFVEQPAYNPMAQLQYIEDVNTVFLGLEAGYWLIQMFAVPNATDVAGWIAEDSELPLDLETNGVSVVTIGMKNLMGENAGADVTVAGWLDAVPATAGMSLTTWTAYVPSSATGDLYNDENAFIINRNTSWPNWATQPAGVYLSFMFCRLTPTIAVALDLPGSTVMAPRPMLRQPFRKFYPHSQKRSRAQRDMEHRLARKRDLAQLNEPKPCVDDKPVKTLTTAQITRLLEHLNL